ncbi:NADH dehydrogenase (quinone) subunit D [candidate division KSB1 bacterium]|nr:NADH dehydrogenase (quinone) subunit D [candidate division KSB1 bacterium]
MNNRPATFRLNEISPERLELPLDAPGDQPLTINLGPSHPAMHGTIRMVTDFVGERIANVEVECGFLHRGFEKMGECRNYVQMVPYTDRLNYVSPFINNFGFAATVEKLFDIPITERCAWLRTMFAEIARISDHLTCLAAIALETGAMTPFLYFLQCREDLWEHINHATGARQTVSYARIGGLARDLPDGWIERAAEIINKMMPLLDDIHGLLDRNRIFLDRMQGVGVCPKDDAINFGFTGPFLRSTGVAYDIRKVNPYLKYDAVEFEVPVGKYGDNYDRYYVRMREIEESIKICFQCFNQIPAGPINNEDYRMHLPAKAEVYRSIEGLINHFKVVLDGPQPPKGEIYHAVEAANGELGFYLVSDGTGTAYRLHVRAPSFLILGSLDRILIGHQLADIIPIFGTVNMVGGECDR